MKRVKSIIFNRFDLNSESAKKSKFLAENLSSHSYSEEVGYGFNEVVIIENKLSANLLKRTPTFIQDYNEQNNELVKRQILLFSSIPFSIDFDQNLLIIQGGITQINVIKSIFRNIFDFDYQVEAINLSAHLFLEQLIKKQINFNIQQITIKGFNYKNGMVGRFAGEIIQQATGNEIVQLYKSDIAKISFNIKVSENESFILQAFPNGSIKFIADEVDYLFLIDYIKTIIFP